MTAVFRLGFRSLLYRKKQYVSLLIVCMVGVGVSLFCLFLVNGMLASLEHKARLYYGGDLMFIGGKNDLSFDYVDDFIETLTPLFPAEVGISARFDYDARYSSLYFEGAEVKQRVIKGVDFDREMDLFRGFNYLEGNAEDMADSNGILLSEPIARNLGVHVGDSITFLLITAQGYTNTAELQVQGIFRDSSLFGMYTSYMDIDCLRESYGAKSHWANRICLSFPQGHTIKSSDLSFYQSELEKHFVMFPLVEDKQIFYDDLQGGKFEQPHYLLVSLYANLEDLKILLDAMNLITSFVILILIAIIVIGVSSTYRVIVMKRINEIGIYKAIGMRRTDIIKVLLSEMTVLIGAGCVAGIVFSVVLCRIIVTFNFSFVPAFDIFLVNGVLRPEISGSQFLIISILVYVTTSLAVLFSVQKSIKTTPVEALGVTE